MGLFSLKKTQVLSIDQQSLEIAKKYIADGEVVAFPTETVYGLGANAFNETAVKKIFVAKGRPSDNPLIVHVADKQQVYSIASEVTADALRVMDCLMPGPITIVLKKQSTIPHCVTGGLDTVAIRMPSSKQAQQFLSVVKYPICAPSANTSSRPSPTSWQHVAEDMDGKVPLILKGDDCQVGIESTVLDLTRDVPLILRPGMVTKSEIEAVLGKEVFFPDAIDKSMNSPGIRYKHYAPACETFLNTDGNLQKITDFLKQNENAGLVALDKHKNLAQKFFSLGNDAQSGAHNVFSALRDAEKVCDKLLIVWDIDGEDADGVFNRVIKSCGGKII
ncbi:MAG: threonylcarbamoyl-AMP synthase [Clostridiales bacterium]|nr:threonylcarbamoyl-AMP synthase [Clostridiales bacterium]